MNHQDELAHSSGELWDDREVEDNEEAYFERLQALLLDSYLRTKYRLASRQIPVGEEPWRKGKS